MKRAQKQEAEVLTADWPTSGFATIKQACKFLNMSRPTFLRLRDSGAIKQRSIGETRSVRIPWASLHAYVNS